MSRLREELLEELQAHAHQLSLELAAERSRAQTHAEAAERFHEANPQVYAALVRRARRAQARGFRPGIGCLFELLRWSHGLTTSGDEFLLNNNYRAWYARRIMECEPDLAGFFDLRKVTTTTRGTFQWHSTK